MTSTRPRLSIRTVQQSAEEKEALLRGALEQHHLLRWTYNRTVMQVAPQLLYIRNDSLHCDAIVLQRDGVPPQERKLGAFKVAGLNAVSALDDAFEPSTDIDLADPRYAAGIVARA